MIDKPEAERQGFVLSRKDVETRLGAPLEDGVIFRLMKGTDYQEVKPTRGKPYLRFHEIVYRALEVELGLDTGATEQDVREVAKITDEIGVIDRIPPNQKMVLLKDGRIVHVQNNRVLRKGMRLMLSLDKHGRLVAIRNRSL
jgi:hypothetical protein